MKLGQIVTFPRTNCNIGVSCETCGGKQSVGKVPSIVIQMAVHERSIINYVHYSVCTVFQQGICQLLFIYVF